MDYGAESKKAHAVGVNLRIKNPEVVLSHKNVLGEAEKVQSTFVRTVPEVKPSV